MELIVHNIDGDANLDEATKAQQVLIVARREIGHNWQCLQIAEVQEMYLTAADRAQLEKHRNGVNALLQAEIEMERTVFIFQQYLEMARRRI